MKNSRFSSATAWGREEENVTPRVRQFIFSLFTKINKYIFLIIFASVLVNFLLILFIVFGVDYSEAYAVDGTIYSCRILTDESFKK